MWTRKNLDVLRGLNCKSVNLVYADPPFNSNKSRTIPVTGTMPRTHVVRAIVETAVWPTT